MEAQLSDLKAVAVDPIDHAMLVRYTARPKARKGMFERFGLAHTGKGLALRLTNQLVDPLHHAPVLLLPIKIVFPCLV